MKKIYTKFFLLLITPFLVLTACEEDETIPNDAPRIAFSVPAADLQGIETVDGVGGPAIQGTVQSDAGLREVTIELLKTSGNEVIQQITTFSNVDSKLYIINFVPAYTPEVTGLRVVAVDVQNRSVEKVIGISVNEEVPKLTFSPADGPVGTQVTANVTVHTLAEGDIASLMLGDMEITNYTLAENGRTITFTVPEGAVTAALTLTPAGEEPVVSETEFTVTEKPKEIVTHSNIVVNAQANRNDEGVVTAFSAEGKTFTLAEGMDAEVSKDIDFIVADSGGDDYLDLFSPAGESWLDGNYYGENSWPVKNETKLLHLSDKDLAYFESITAEELNALTVGTAYKTRIQPKESAVGYVILFETADGKKGLVYVKAHDPNTAEGTKADIFTFDIKVLE
ncbi:hypothetical protein [Cesiribacter sp. SM1]|uniref:hypothetical protein n=1 Tax=Cesiribacter sp. SM1 TaxID=2861196 RepID=UPI001CD6DA74|nr:hypothetical protein [Cesiribacter sp. SM1]